MSEQRNIVLTANTHAEARKEARRIYRGVVLRFISTQRYCENGFILTVESKQR